MRRALRVKGSLGKTSSGVHAGGVEGEGGGGWRLRGMG